MKLISLIFVMAGMSIRSMTFFVFLILKSTEQIDWSWWLVLLPVCIPMGSFLLVLVSISSLEIYDSLLRNQ